MGKSSVALIYNGNSCLQCFSELREFINDSVVIIIKDVNSYIRNLESKKLMESIYPKGIIYFSNDSSIINIITPAFIISNKGKTLLIRYDYFYRKGKLRYKRIKKILYN